MKSFLKVFFSILVVVIAGALIAAAVMPKEVALERSITINAPVSEVYDYARMLKNQEDFSVWVMADPNIQLEYSGVDGTVGATSSWVSDDKNVGVGEQEITALVENERIEVEVRFTEPMESVISAYNTFEETEDGQTLVTDGFTSTTPWPMNLLCPIIKNMLGKQIDQNLANMKANIEG